MKAPVAVTLIIMGALLIMVPALSDYLGQCNVVEVLSKSSATRASIDGWMSTEYRLGCWASGTAMIAVAVIASLKNSSPLPTEN